MDLDPPRLTFPPENAKIPAEEEIILSLEQPHIIDLDPALKRVMEVDFLRVRQKQ